MDQPQTLDYAQPELRAPSRRGSGFLCVCATMFIAGLGHWLAGHRRRGVLWFIALTSWAGVTFLLLGLPHTLPMVLLAFVLSVSAQLFLLVRAYLCGRRSSPVLLRQPALRYLAGVGFLLLALFANPAAFAVTHLIIPFWSEGFLAPTPAMAPALATGDHFIAAKRLSIRRWDIVVFRYPQDPKINFVKRLVALPGETVQIIDGDIWINGHPIPRPAVVAPYRDDPRMPSRRATKDNPLILGPDEYFVLGDNSAASYDSRFWTIAAPAHQPGAVPASYLIGRVTAIYWPPAHWKSFD